MDVACICLHCCAAETAPRDRLRPRDTACRRYPPQHFMKEGRLHGAYPSSALQSSFLACDPDAPPPATHQRLKQKLWYSAPDPGDHRAEDAQHLPVGEHADL